MEGGSLTALNYPVSGRIKKRRICFTCLHYAGGYCLQHDKRVRAKQRACSEFLRSEYNTWLLEKQAEGEALHVA